MSNINCFFFTSSALENLSIVTEIFHEEIRAKKNIVWLILIFIWCKTGGEDIFNKKRSLSIFGLEDYFFINWVAWGF